MQSNVSQGNKENRNIGHASNEWRDEETHQQMQVWLYASEWTADFCCMHFRHDSHSSKRISTSNRLVKEKGWHERNPRNNRNRDQRKWCLRNSGRSAIYLHDRPTSSKYIWTKLHSSTLSGHFPNQTTINLERISSTTKRKWKFVDASKLQNFIIRTCESLVREEIL